MGIVFGGKEPNEKETWEFEEDIYEELLDDIRERLYKAGIPLVGAIMSHVKESLEHWKKLRGIK